MYRVDCREAYLLGRFLGDGWFEKRSVAISTASERDVELIDSLIRNVYSIEPSVKRRVYDNGHVVYLIRVWSKDIYSKYANIFGTTVNKSLKANRQNVEFMNSEDVLCFILGVFDSECWIYNWRGC